MAGKVIYIYIYVYIFKWRTPKGQRLTYPTKTQTNMLFVVYSLRQILNPKDQIEVNGYLYSRAYAHQLDTPPCWLQWNKQHTKQVCLVFKVILWYFLTMKYLQIFLTFYYNRKYWDVSEWLNHEIFLQLFLKETCKCEYK